MNSKVLVVEISGKRQEAKKIGQQKRILATTTTSSFQTIRKGMTQTGKLSMSRGIIRIGT